MLDRSPEVAVGNHRPNVRGDCSVGKCVLDLHASRETGLVHLMFYRD